jgi:hypothetical protein
MIIRRSEVHTRGSKIRHSKFNILLLCGSLFSRDGKVSLEGSKKDIGYFDDQKKYKTPGQALLSKAG